MAEYLVDDFCHFWAANLLWRYGDDNAELHPHIEILARRLEKESQQEQAVQQRRDRCANSAEEQHSSPSKQPSETEAVDTKSQIEVQRLQDMVNCLLSEKVEAKQELSALKRVKVKDGEAQSLQQKIAEAAATAQELQGELAKEKDLKHEVELQLLGSHNEVQRLQDMVNCLLSEKAEAKQELSALKRVKDGETQSLQQKIAKAAATAQELQGELAKEKDLKRVVDLQLLESHIREVETKQDLQEKLRNTLSEVDNLEKAKTKAEDRCFSAEESLAEALKLQSEMQCQLSNTAMTQLLLDRKEEEIENLERNFSEEQRRRQEMEMELVAKNDMMIDLCSARDLEIKQLKASNSLLLEEQNSMQKEIVACKLEQERCSDNKEVDRIITELEGIGDSLIEADDNEEMQIEKCDKSHKQLVMAPRSPEKVWSLSQRHQKSRTQRQATIEVARKEKKRQITAEKRSQVKKGEGE